MRKFLYSIVITFCTIPVFSQISPKVQTQIDQMARDRSLVAVDQVQAYAWAGQHSWHQLKAVYDAAFGAVA